MGLYKKLEHSVDMSNIKFVEEHKVDVRPRCMLMLLKQEACRYIAFSARWLMLYTRA